MKLLAPILFLLFSIQIVVGQEDPAFTHGTLITAMGNRNGIVVVTDSMITKTDASGNSWPDLSPKVRKPCTRIFPMNQTPTR
jgi:hypothetical protein